MPRHPTVSDEAYQLGLVLVVARMCKHYEGELCGFCQAEAVIAAGYKQVPDGETRPQWAVRNLRSGGMTLHWSQESALRAFERSRRSDPLEPGPDPHDLAHRWWTEHVDGSESGTPWTVLVSADTPTYDMGYLSLPAEIQAEADRA